MTVVAKPYNTWASRRPVAGKQKRIRREKEVAAIQRWAAGKTDTIEKHQNQVIKKNCSS